MCLTFLQGEDKSLKLSLSVCGYTLLLTSCLVKYGKARGEAIHFCRAENKRELRFLCGSDGNANPKLCCDGPD